MNSRSNSLIAILFFMSTTLFAQTVIDLYPQAIPNSKPSANEEVSEFDGILRVSKITRPTLTIFLAPREIANGTAVVIYPGGGYRINAIGHEGMDVAKKFNEMGISAFVLKYRIPNDATMEKKEVGPLQDAQQAIKIVRERAKEWNVNPNRIGIMGF